MVTADAAKAMFDPRLNEFKHVCPQSKESQTRLQQTNMCFCPPVTFQQTWFYFD